MSVCCSMVGLGVYLLYCLEKVLLTNGSRYLGRMPGRRGEREVREARGERAQVVSMDHNRNSRFKLTLTDTDNWSRRKLPTSRQPRGTGAALFREPLPSPRFCSQLQRAERVESLLSVVSECLGKAPWRGTERRRACRETAEVGE